MHITIKNQILRLFSGLLLLIVAASTCAADAIKFEIDGQVINFYRYTYQEKQLLLGHQNVLFSPDELNFLTQKNIEKNCKIPDAEEARFYLSKIKIREQDNLSDFYWVNDSDKKTHGYALYMHVRTGELMEFGNMVFPASVFLVCD